MSGNTTSLPRYRYSDLQDPKYDIRLVTILPGDGSEDLHVRIWHDRLETSRVDPPPGRLSLEEPRESRPPGWNVTETLEGRYMFHRLDDSGDWQTTWDHWDPHVDKAAYAPLDPQRTVCTSAQFHALSYVWGTTDLPRETLWVHSDYDHHYHLDHDSVLALKLPTSTLQVLPSLATALCYQRRRDEQVTLWVDAICINQENDNERQEQVLRMGEIYSSAVKVILWLGEPSRHSSTAMDAIARVASNIQYLTVGSIITVPGSDWDWRRLNRKQLPLTRDECEGLQNILARDWFRRVWVVQEAILGGTRAVITCGDASVPWLGFSVAIVWMSQLQHLPSESFREDVLMVKALCFSFRRRSSIISISSLTAYRICSIPHDLIYGMLSLLPEGVVSRIHPDYARPLEDVYKEFIVANMSHFRRLELILYCTARHRELHWPSWAFRFQGGRNEQQDPTRLTLRKQFAACFSACEAEYLPPSLLKATDVQVGVISKVAATIQPSSVVGSEAHMAACLDGARKWEPDDLYTASYVTGESLLDAYAATLIEGDFRDKSPDLTELPTVAEWTAQDSINALFGPMAHTGAMYLPVMTSWERQALESVCGRCFFRCENGYIGLGADGCNEGMFPY